MNTWQNVGFMRGKLVTEKNPSPKHQCPGIYMQKFSKYISFVRCTECRVLAKAQKYSCQLYVILATDSQTVGQIE